MERGIKQMDKVKDKSEECFRYECEQAMLRTRFEKPDVDEEWEKFQQTLSSTSVVETQQPARRRRGLVYSVWASVAVAAVWMGCMFWAWKEHAPAPVLPQESQFPQLLTSAVPQQPILIEATDETQTTKQQIAVGRSSVLQEQQGVVVSKTVADYSQATAQKVRRHLVSIPRGKMYQLVLNDGTQVWLNADSRLSFPSRFAEDRREVKLEGEAYFKVASNPQKPFVIVTDQMTTQVLGTEFNVKAYKDSEHHVTLVHGSVKVSLPTCGKEVMLVPGEDIACQGDSYVVKQVDTSYYSHWMEGYFYYDDVALVDILRDLGRWYNLSIAIEPDEALMNLRLHFIAERSEDVQQVIENLNAYDYLSVVQEENRLVVKRK